MTTKLAREDFCVFVDESLHHLYQCLCFGNQADSKPCVCVSVCESVRAEGLLNG